MINRNKKGQFKSKTKYKTLMFLFTFCVLIPGAFYGVVFGGHAYYENRVASIWQEGYEVGHFDGLIEADANVREEMENNFYAKLSTNPQVSFLFQKYFPEQEIAKTMRAISLSESKGKQVQHYKLNRNGSWDCGFFQTNTIHRSKGESMESFCDRMNNNLEENFRMARKIYDERKKMFGDGFTAWSDYNNGKYLSYIK